MSITISAVLRGKRSGSGKNYLRGPVADPRLPPFGGRASPTALLISQIFRQSIIQNPPVVTFQGSFEPVRCGAPSGVRPRKREIVILRDVGLAKFSNNFGEMLVRCAEVKKSGLDLFAEDQIDFLAGAHSGAIHCRIKTQGGHSAARVFNTSGPARHPLRWARPARLQHGAPAMLTSP